MCWPAWYFKGEGRLRREKRLGAEVLVSPMVMSRRFVPGMRRIEAECVALFHVRSRLCKMYRARVSRINMRMCETCQ